MLDTALSYTMIPVFRLGYFGELIRYLVQKAGAETVSVITTADGVTPDIVLFVGVLLLKDFELLFKRKLAYQGEIKDHSLNSEEKASTVREIVQLNQLR